MDKEYQEVWTTRMIPFSILVVLLLATQPALAYIDAGAGGMLIQVVVAGSVGLGIWLKLFWRRFLSFFSKSKTSKT